MSKAVTSDYQRIADEKKAILTEVFPADCMIVGSENLDDMCNGRDAFDDDESAFRNATGESLELLANATAIISFVLLLVNSWRSSRSGQVENEERRPDLEEIDVLVLTSVEKSGEVPKQSRTAIYVSIVKRRA